ncbi:MAG: hypothetical protein AAFY56_08745 [Pseudomonadota bacterium]
MSNVAIFQAKPEPPYAIILRHAYLQKSNFSANERGGVIYGLLNEPDPIAVVDERAQRMMSERDVAGLANLENFVQSGGEPERVDYTRQQIDVGAAALGETLAGNDAGAMPLIYSAAAEIWAGIRREWPLLDKDQRQMVRDYSRHGLAKPMTLEFYSRIFGLPEDQAQQVLERDQYLRQLAALRNDLSHWADALGDTIVQQSILQEMQNMHR